jgi:hypothetical protein
MRSGFAANSAAAFFSRRLQFSLSQRERAGGEFTADQRPIKLFGDYGKCSVKNVWAPTTCVTLETRKEV